uniref:Transcription factor Iwr1 domain-containing protein n=1 Tax=Panagrolaimus sp. ES5 TaxID=591445 RepID=A0AC34FQM4_9BILA
MSVEQEQVQVQIPLSTVIRNRRKRGAPPSSDCVTVSKRNRVEGEEKSGENSIADEERQLMFIDDGNDASEMFVDDGSEDSEPDLDDPDSNDENHYLNEYPDEGDFDEDRDTEYDFDHFGDADEDYNNCVMEED